MKVKCWLWICVTSAGGCALSESLVHVQQPKANEGMKAFSSQPITEQSFSDSAAVETSGTRCFTQKVVSLQGSSGIKFLLSAGFNTFLLEDVFVLTGSPAGILSFLNCWLSILHTVLKYIPTVCS